MVPMALMMCLAAHWAVPLWDVALLQGHHWFIPAYDLGFRRPLAFFSLAPDAGPCAPGTRLAGVAKLAVTALQGADLFSSTIEDKPDQIGINQGYYPCSAEFLPLERLPGHLRKILMGSQGGSSHDQHLAPNSSNTGSLTDVERTASLSHIASSQFGGCHGASHDPQYRQGNPLMHMPDWVYSQDVDFLLREVVRASSAAPTFLPAATVHVQLGYRSGETGETIRCIDGGVAANNPSMVALTFCKAIGHEISDTAVLSLGTGERRALDALQLWQMDCAAGF